MNQSVECVNDPNIVAAIKAELQLLGVSDKLVSASEVSLCYPLKILVTYSLSSTSFVLNKSIFCMIVSNVALVCLNAAGT